MNLIKSAFNLESYSNFYTDSRYMNSINYKVHDIKIVPYTIKYLVSISNIELTFLGIIRATKIQIPR